MGKIKNIRYEIAKTLENVFIPEISEKQIVNLDGTWNIEQFAKKDIVLELGCGKGEYALSLARKHPEKVIIGFDIKSDRICVGAQKAISEQLDNIFFVRTRIELIKQFFDENTISEIWITFPDPYLRKKYTKKRLTSSGFLNLYKSILKPHGIIHLKTDNTVLYEYTCEVLEETDAKIIIKTDDLYQSEVTNEDALTVKSRYEELYLPIVKTIKYIEFNF